jgi:hypothetical protein
MWDNRLSKRNPKAPDFKCRNRSCDGVIWPPKAGKPNAASNGRSSTVVAGADPLLSDEQSEQSPAESEVPF